MLNLAIAAEPLANDAENMFDLSRESLGLADRIYQRLALQEEIQAGKTVSQLRFFAPRAALATKKLRELEEALDGTFEDAMAMILEMEAKPEFYKSKQYEKLGEFLPASEVLLQVSCILIVSYNKFMWSCSVQFV
jgi:hypothetical protein